MAGRRSRGGAAVPAAGRARYLRRAATAILDELDPLADALADAVGQPRTEGVLAELLPSVGGLHDLADDGPRALRDKRLGRIPVLRAGRRSLLQSAPVGVIGVRGGRASPCGRPGAGDRRGDPGGQRGRALDAARRADPRGLRTRRGAAGADRGRRAGGGPERPLRPRGRPRPPDAKGTMVVLDGAPLDRTVTGALWAAFAGGGRHRAAVGRLVVVPSAAEELLGALVTGAERLHPGDPRRPDTEIGPLRSPETCERVEALVDEAVADGAALLCGGPLDVPGVAGAFYAPAVLRGVRPEARILREPVPGPVLAVVEASGEDEAIALAKRAPAVSVWAGSRTHAERVAREARGGSRLGQRARPFDPRRRGGLAEHVDARRLASQPTRLRSARWLPYDPQLVRAATASAPPHARPRDRAPARPAHRRGAAGADRGAAREGSARALGGPHAEAGREERHHHAPHVLRPAGGGRPSAPGPRRGRSRGGCRRAAGRR